MLRQGLRRSLRSGDALWKTLVEELSNRPVFDRDTFSIVSHGNSVVHYCRMNHYSALNGVGTKRCGLPDALAGSLGFQWQGPCMSQSLMGRSFRTSGFRHYGVVEVPPLGAETISEGTVGAILKQPGDVVVEDDVIAQLETDKVTIDVKYQNTVPGTIKAIHFAEGDTVEVGQAFADVEETPDAVASQKESQSEEEPATTETDTPATQEKKKAVNKPAPKTEPIIQPTPPQQRGERPERRVKMTRLRKRIAERLKGAQNTYAMLTTFNEVDMTNLMDMRNVYKDAFLESHGVKLGFMSAFVKASANALEYVPAVNGVIEDDEILYRDYYDVSVAVSTPKGLVVPVLRDVDSMSFSDVEKKINELGRKARDGALSIDEMAGGTFTISNGGVFGSLMGTPIINPPQSAILGMHATKMRPAVVDGQVVPRPMMYLALTYDHRLVDGREAVTFLKRIKEIIEDPRRLLLDV